MGYVYFAANLRYELKEQKISDEDFINRLNADTENQIHIDKYILRDLLDGSKIPSKEFVQATEKILKVKFNYPYSLAQLAAFKGDENVSENEWNSAISQVERIANDDIPDDELFQPMVK